MSNLKIKKDFTATVHFNDEYRKPYVKQFIQVEKALVMHWLRIYFDFADVKSITLVENEMNNGFVLSKENGYKSFELI